MADQDPIPPGNGGQTPDNAPQAATIAQYIKDLSVESPSAPQVFQWQEQPALDVQFHLNVDRISDELHEVTLKIEVSARSEKGVHFFIDLSYAGLFGLRNIPDEALAPFLLAEAPRLIFPFARQVIAESTTGAGFPPLLLDPIDFGAAYLQQAQVAQGEGGNGESGAANGQTDPADSDQSPADSDQSPAG